MTGSLRPEDVVPRLRGRLGREYRFVERCTSTQRVLGEDDPDGAGVAANVGQQAVQLPIGARTPATSLLLETGREIDRAELLVALLDRLERRYDEWLADDL